MCWLTPRSCGCGASCRRISALTSPNRAAVARREGDECEAEGLRARAPVDPTLDRSGARVRTLALGLFVAYGVLGAKLLVLGLSHDPPQTLKAAADDAVSGARPDLFGPERRHSRHRRQDDVGVHRAEPHHRQGRGGRAHHRRAAGCRRQGAARAVELEKRLHLGQAADHAKRAGRNLSSRIARRRIPSPKTSASIPMDRSARM